MPERPAADVLLEAERIASLAASSRVPVWLAGGAAIQLHCRAVGGESRLSRTPLDIDLATAKGQARPVAAFLEQLGYRSNVQFNALNGRRRLLFYDLPNNRQVDVFVGTFAMCHTIPIIARVDGIRPGGLLPASELLLTKLQIVELTDKDRQDILNLLLHLEVGDQDEHGVLNGSVVGDLCARDWGLWRTCQLNLERVAASISTVELPQSLQADIRRRLRTLSDFIDRAPKTRRWRARARIGDRMRWYELPDEVGEAVPIRPATA